MPERDYYEVLGIARNASSDEIKRSYRNLARKHHPDVNPGDKGAEARFKEAQQAYDILSDPEKRKLYDQFGTAAFSGAGAAGPRSGASEWAAQAGPGFENVDFSQFFGPGFGTQEAEGGGIFEEIMGRVRGGRGARRAGPRHGRTTEARLAIPFLTAVRGGETTVEVERTDGRRETLVVKIPPGTDTGSRLRLKGRGEPGPGGGPAGDLIVLVEVQSHPYFTRQGRDLSVEVPVTIPEAVLGARVEVPTLEGRKTLPIPPGSAGGQRLRLRGQGVPASKREPAGDLYVALKVVAPRSVDDESRELIRKFGERNPMSPREGLWTT